MRDAFGLFRGWCRSAPSCLEYTPTSVPTGAAEIAPLRCCGAAPAAGARGGAGGLRPAQRGAAAFRRKYDERLLEPDARRAAQGARRRRVQGEELLHGVRGVRAGARGDARRRRALCNRALAYLRVGRADAALTDAERAAELAPEWAKARFRVVEPPRASRALRRRRRTRRASATSPRMPTRGARSRRRAVRQREAAKPSGGDRRGAAVRATSATAEDRRRTKRSFAAGVREGRRQMGRGEGEAFAREWRAILTPTLTPLLTRRDPAEESKPAVARGRRGGGRPRARGQRPRRRRQTGRASRRRRRRRRTMATRRDSRGGSAEGPRA